MAFNEKMKEFLERSVDASRDALSKAGSQAQVWGEMGKLKIEILQLRSRAQRLFARLGTEVYELLVDREEPMVGAYTAGMAPLIEELKTIDADIERKEAAFRDLGGKDSDLDEHRSSD